jgi:hypothetical protein
MAAQIDILGESTTRTFGTTTTIYTVPASKAARVRISFFIEAHSTDNPVVSFLIGSPGTEATWQFNQPTDNTDIFSGLVRDGTTFYRLTNVGVQEEAAINFDGNTEQYMVGPIAWDYFLSTGDTVKFTHNGNNDFDDILIQAQGVEDDA